jgi:threonine dehydratase
MAWAFREAGLVVEGGGAVGLAAALEGRLNDGDGAPSGTPSPLVIVVSGGNVDLSVLDRVLASQSRE